MELEAKVEALQRDLAKVRSERDVLRRENQLLQQSVFDLSHKLTSLEQTNVHRVGAFDIDTMLLPSALTSGKGTPGSSQAVLRSAMAEEDKAAMVRRAMHAHGLEPLHMDGATGGSDHITGSKGLLTPRSKLVGHTGAVYVCEFSPNGRLMASGSFDRTVRLWDTVDHFEQSVSTLAPIKEGGHKQLVSGISWACDSRSLVSCSFDRTVKLWDVEQGKLLLTCKPGSDSGAIAASATSVSSATSATSATGATSGAAASGSSAGTSGVTSGVTSPLSASASGMMQCVMHAPRDARIFFAATTKNSMYMFDARQPQSSYARVWDTASCVNTLYVFHDGMRVYTGDQRGRLLLWDVRQASAPQEETQVVLSGQGITHVHASRPPRGVSQDGGCEGRYLAVNSFDNMVRVYDRRGHHTHKQPLQLRHTLTGHTNKNWPIRSSFYRGQGYSYPSATKSQAERDAAYPDEASRSMLLATGSTDAKVYLFDISASSSVPSCAGATDTAAPSAGSQAATSAVQVLEGHRDKVYCATFHPHELLLASGSADCSVRLWSTASKGSHDD
eukprot:g2546.t1